MVMKKTLVASYSGLYGTGLSIPYTDTWYNTAEILQSEEHYAWRKHSDGGGPFKMLKTSYVVRPSYADTARLRGNWVGVPAESRSGDFAKPTYKTDVALKASGTTAIARSLPTNPSAQLSTALGEIMKDGLPQLIGSTAFKEQVRTAKKAGNEYLNYEFGWLPIISDLKKLAHAVTHRDEIMYGYKKYSDRQIRRRYLFPVQEGSFAGSGYLAYAKNLSTDHAYLYDYKTSYKTSTWFSGAFKYHVPMGPSFLSKADYYRQEASKILGLELTPEVVWNLAPWSWALDWFANTGDIIHNITRMGQDGLVMRYGYIMSHSMSDREVYAIGQGPVGQFNRKIAGQQTYYYEKNETKQRLKATPYGFGLTYDGLSNTQKAIVTALGLSRAF